jgi:dCMP deaminase
MTRPSKDLLMMAQAVLMSKMSTCSRLKVGCVVCDDTYEQIAVGYNGGYRGGPNGCLKNEVGGCGCVHAETNAVIKAVFRPTRAFVTDSPCLLCAAAMINAGITCVTYLREYRDSYPIEVLRGAGVHVQSVADDEAEAAALLIDSFGLRVPVHTRMKG